MFDSFLAAIKSVRRRKMRTFLTMLSIAIGTASVVLIANIGETGKALVNKELDGLGIGGIVIATDKKLTTDNLTDSEVSIIKKCNDVKNVVPLIVNYTSLYYRNKSEESVLWGIGDSFAQVVSINLIHGRFINAGDVKSSARVCVVTVNLAQKIYKRDNIVGKTIQVKLNNSLEEFTVVGIISSGGSMLQGMLTQYIPAFVYVPYSTVGSILGNTGFTQIAVETKDISQTDTVAKNIISSMFKQTGNNYYAYENLSKQKDQLNNILSIFTMILSAIAAISLVVAGLGIMSVMIVSINERTKEIGIKKSIGATKFIIMREFLCESLAISMAGSGIGCLAGIAITLAGCLIYSAPIALNFNLILIGVSISILTGLIFGVYPAMKAAKLNPVDALRHD